MGERFTAGRVPDSGIEALFSTRSEWQAWLDVEGALAATEAELGMIPREAADAIVAACRIEKLDVDRIRREIHRTSHPMMPLIVELSNAVGEPHGGWVHWGATTQNITQTGDMVIVRRAHSAMLRLLGRIMSALGTLADESADMVMAGRTHGQHAVPITYGFKVASWISEFGRHIDRMRELEPRLFCALVGGAAGNFASMGSLGPAVQRGVAERLGLGVTEVPSRSMVDNFAEFVSLLGLIGATCGKIGQDVYNLMKTEYGEVEEPVPAGTVGSSTMPQKRNPQLCQDVLGIASELRSLVPLALEAVQSEHEADHTPTVSFSALTRASIIMGELLERIHLIVGGLRLNPERMVANLALSGGMISAEALMLELGKIIGRQHAHDVVFEASQATATRGASFPDLLAADPRVTAHLSRSEIDVLLDPATHTGLSSQIAHEQAEVARRYAVEMEALPDV